MVTPGQGQVAAKGRWRGAFAAPVKGLELLPSDWGVSSSFGSAIDNSHLLQGFRDSCGILSSQTFMNWLL